MNELLSTHFISLFLILLFSIRLSTQKSLRDRELRYFWLTVVTCLLLVIQDLLETAASEDPTLRTWRTILSILGYVLRCTAAVSLVLVICKPNQRKLWIWIPWMINTLVCCTAFFTDIAFGFDSHYQFYRGPLGIVSFIVPMIYLAAILWLTFRYYNVKDRFLDRLILITCAVFCILSSLLDADRGGVRLHEAILISSIFYYLFLRSYDMRRDSLTRLLNRQSLYDDNVSMRNHITAAASLDMIGLKETNEREGYQAGDAALKTIGRCMRDFNSPHVRGYRIGGDEFVMLFTNLDEITVRQTLSDIRKKVEEAGYSISCGYAMKEKGDNPDDIIRKSDMKMFEDKAAHYSQQWKNRHRTEEQAEGSFGGDMRKAVEVSVQPMAVCRFTEQHDIETLCVSDGFCKLFGYDDRKAAVEKLNTAMDFYIHPDDKERFSGASLRFAEGIEDLDVIYRTRAGMATGYRMIHARGTRAHTEDGERIAYVWYMDEGTYVEDEKENTGSINEALNQALHEESILRATHYDELTGLPNLAWFFKLYEAWKIGVQGAGKQAALLYIDLNGMKYFNSRHGFAEGDRMLKAFSELLVKHFGKENCCHVGADRFAAFTTEDTAETKILGLFADARVMNEGRTLPVRVGIHSTTIENVPVTSAYDRAKMACDEIRKTDTSGYGWYNPELRENARKFQDLVENIDRAIEERWIQVYYQPIVRAVSEKICDEEALARWNDPVKGFLSPADFIPQLEESGLIYKLDLCMLDQVLEKMQAQKAEGVNVVPHSINLSRSDFETCDIVEEVRRRVDAAGIERKMISVEITESVIGTNFEFMKQRIDKFRELGFPVWMDDFGSGYSSLDVLQSVSFDLIKFDMSFTRKLDEGENGKVILTEMMKMATSLNLDTICEGVETLEQVRFVQEIGCSKLQGFFYSKPIPLATIREQIANGSRIPAEDSESAFYYEKMGRVDLYDLGLIAGVKEDSFRNAFSTLPMAVIEVNGRMSRFVRSNPSYRDFMLRFFDMDITAMTKTFEPFSDSPFMINVVEKCARSEGSTLFDEIMENGAVVHSFARKICTNPTNGCQAIAVAVLYISD